MEAAGLTLSAIALASLFSTCVECFEYYAAARDAEEDFKTVLVRLDLEKTRLLIWGDQVGILKTTGQGRSPYLDTHNETLNKVFVRLRNLLRESDGSRDKYGRMSRTAQDPIVTMIRDDLSRNSKRLFASAWDEFKREFGAKINRTFYDPTLRIRWAISGRSQFEGLVIEARGLIDSLNQYIEVAPQVVDSIVYREITIVDNLARLSLIQEASEGVYPRWSDKAQTVISQSVAGTLDHRDSEEVHHDQNPPTVPRSAETTSSIYAPRVQLPNSAKLVFVLTEPCYRATSCDPVTFGDDALSGDHYDVTLNFAHETDWRSEWSIGHICFRAIEPDDPEQWQKWEMDNSTSQSAGTVLIYCPPCVCQVHTAMSLISSMWRWTPLITIKIRVDYRIPSRCCEHGSGRAKIHSLRARLQDGTDQQAKKFDRPWLDQRRYHLTGNDFEEAELPVSEQTAGDYKNPGRVWPPLLQVIVLGECESMTDMLNSPPFRRVSKMPEANQIYLMGTYSETGRDFLGEFNPRRPLPGDNTASPGLNDGSNSSVNGFDRSKGKRKLDEDPY